MAQAPGRPQVAALIQCGDASRLSRTHRLPDRGDDRDALPARRGSAHRRHLGLHRAPAARAAGEAAACPRSPARRSTGSVALEPDLVLGFSDLQADIAAELVRAGIEVHLFNHRSVAEILRMIRDARRHGRLRGEGGRACRAARSRRRGDARGRRAAAAPPARLLRGMGRAADRRHPLGGRADRNRRRRRLLSGACARVARPRPHHRGPGRSRAPRARHHLRLLVRQEIPPRDGRRASRLGRDPRRARRRAARDQVVDHPAARARGAHRRARRDPRAHRALGER